MFWQCGAWNQLGFTFQGKTGITSAFSLSLSPYSRFSHSFFLFALPLSLLCFLLLFFPVFFHTLLTYFSLSFFSSLFLLFLSRFLSFPLSFSNFHKSIIDILGQFLFLSIHFTKRMCFKKIKFGTNGLKYPRTLKES